MEWGKAWLTVSEMRNWRNFGGAVCNISNAAAMDVEFCFFLKASHSV